MTLTFKDMKRIGDELIRLSRGSEIDDDELVRSVSTGPTDSVVAEATAKLCGVLLVETSQEVREVARGALVAVAGRDERAPFFLRHALRTVSDMRGVGRRLATPELDEQLAEAALSMYRKLQDSEGIEKDERLVYYLDDFREKHEHLLGSVLFSRFVDDLEFLAGVLTDNEATEKQRRCARAALAYLELEQDAIPDDYGLVGILDDAYIARVAAHEIDPIRAVLSGLVDELLDRWPFLGELQLRHGDRTWAPSEFLLLSLAFATGIQPGELRALVVPSVDVLPSCLGVLWSMGLCYEQLTRSRTFRPEVGTHVRQIDGAQVHEVEGYYRQVPDGYPERVPVDEATDVCLAAKRNQRFFRPIEVLSYYVYAEPTRRLSSKKPTDAAAHAVGALERLFQSMDIIRFTNEIPAVGLIAPFGATRDVLASYELHGLPLIEALPTASWRLDDETSRTDSWSKTRGEVPSLLVFRSSADAKAALELDERRVGAVVMPFVDPERDGASLRRMTEDVGVLAVVPEWAEEAQAFLDSESCEFLHVTPTLARSISWPGREAGAGPFHEHGLRISDDLVSRVQLVEVRLEEVEIAFDLLAQLRRTLQSHEDDLPESLETFGLEAINLFFRLASLPVPLAMLADPEREAGLDFNRLEIADFKRRRWSERDRCMADEVSGALHALGKRLTTDNPKHERLRRELEVRPDAVVQCRHRAVGLLERYLGVPAERCLTRRRQRRAVHNAESLVVFEYPGWRRLSETLFAGSASQTRVLGYEWEHSRYLSARQLRAQRRQRNWEAGRRPKRWPEDAPVPSAPPSSESSQSRPNPRDLERLIEEARYKRAIESVDRGGTSEELVEVVVILFRGGGHALFRPEHRVRVANDLIDGVPDRQTLRERRAREVEPGDVLLVTRGADRDDLRARADENLPTGARSRARRWQRVLRELRQQLGEDRAVWKRLQEAGCRRELQTVCGWLRDDHIIGPHSESDLDIIALVSGDDGFVRDIDQCKAAIKAVRGAHRSAAVELAKEVIRQLQKHGVGTVGDEDVIELEDNNLLIRVEDVRRDPIRVPTSMANRTFDST